jgi:glucose-1-phosphate adenylyltransferase
MIMARFQSSDTMSAQTLTFLLAGGQGSRLFELTAQTCKPAVCFDGTTRLIDYTMANIVRSGLTSLVVATQYLGKDVEDHLRKSWAEAFSSGGLDITDGTSPAFGTDGFRGTADAVRRNIDLIDAQNPEHILVLAADHIYEMDYRPMIAAHQASGACVTIAVDIVPRSEASAFGVIDARADGQIKHFVEKPKFPPAMKERPDHCQVSMGIYVLSWDWLRNLLLAQADLHDFGHDVLPVAVAQARAFAYQPPGRLPGGRNYWRDVGTLDAFRETALAFASATPPVPAPFSVLVPDAVLRPLQKTVAHPYVAGSVLMPGCVVCASAVLTNCIVMSGCVIPFATVIGEDEAEDRKWFRRTAGGTTLVSPQMLAKRAQASGFTQASADQPVPFPSMLENGL